MKIIIAGNGKVGAALARQLITEGHDLTLIDSSKKVLDNNDSRFDCQVVQGNCASASVLEDASIRSADLLIAMTGADEVNLLCCLTAHSINPELHTIARIRNPEYVDQVYEMRETFALSMIVSPERQTAQEIERLLKYPGSVRRDAFAKGRAEIVELKIDSKSKLCNVALTAMDSIVKTKVLVCAVVRDGKGITPDGNFVIRDGDRLFVTAPTDAMSDLLRNLGFMTRRTKRVMICGGGRLSYFLAQRLEKTGMEVKIVEKDRDRAYQLGSLLAKASIVEGDASEHEFLNSQRISDQDAVVSLTGLDELNLIISLYADLCGVPHIITKVGHMDPANIPDSLPVGSVVSPKELCAHDIVRYVRAMKNQTGAALSIHPIADGYAEALEFLVDSTTKNCGVPLKRVKLKKNVLLCCIKRGPETTIANGDSHFEVGDTIVLVTSGSRKIYQLNDIFE